MHLLLHELREKNFELYIAAESNWAEVAQMQQELETLKAEKLSQIPDLNRRYMIIMLIVFSLCRSLVETSLLLEAEQEVLALLEQEMNKMTIHKKTNLAVEDQLKAKENRIQKFRNVLVIRMHLYMLIVL